MARRLQHDMTPDRSTVPWVVGGTVAIVILGLLALNFAGADDHDRSHPVATSTQQQSPKGS